MPAALLADQRRGNPCAGRKRSTVEKILTPPLPETVKANRTTFVVKDIRIFMNTINHAIDLMKKSGIDACSERKETEDYIECVVRIPKIQPMRRAQ